jgi:glycosyltransferase involved in cell wall biosynthesis
VDGIYAECGLPRQPVARNEHLNVILTHDRIPDEKFGRYQHAVDVIVFPYAMHGASVSTSMMAHEALASGRPVVVTDVAYFSDLTDGEVLKMPDNQPETIAGAITALRDDASFRESLAARATAYSEQRSWPKVAQCYLDLL